jgi:hypothetical protein
MGRECSTDRSHDKFIQEFSRKTQRRRQHSVRNDMKFFLKLMAFSLSDINIEVHCLL